MNRFIIVSVVLFSTAFTYGKAKNTGRPTYSSTEIASLKGSKFSLKYQAFASHDKEGTVIDTVSHADDYILFSHNGIAYMHFNGKHDSIEYAFTRESNISFGDTPFAISILGDGYFSLFQNEEELNGDYNRVTYLLKKE